MLFGHAQRSQKTCCIRFKANINPHFPVLAIFNSCAAPLSSRAVYVVQYKVLFLFFWEMGMSDCL